MDKADISELSKDSDSMNALMFTLNRMFKHNAEKTDLSSIQPNLERITPDSVIQFRKTQGMEKVSESASQDIAPTVCPYFLCELPEFPAEVINIGVNFAEFNNIISKPIKSYEDNIDKTNL